jgi:hypothetical protein
MLGNPVLDPSYFCGYPVYYLRAMAKTPVYIHPFIDP